MKKIALIVFNYFLGNSLSLINAATSLANEGFDIHIFIDRSFYERAEAHFDEGNISIHTIEIAGHPHENTIAKSRWDAFITDHAAERRNKKRIGQRSILLDGGSVLYSPVRKLKSKTSSMLLERAQVNPSVKTVNNYARKFFPHIVEFYEKIADQIDEDFVCLIGVEPFGLIAATLAADASKKEQSVPVIYYNQELLLEKECHTVEKRMLKALERMCNRMCRFTIIQDERRAAYLRDDNNLEAESIVCVPVSGLAQAYKAKGNFLQDTYKIPRGKKVLLYAGNIMPWAMCLEMAQAAQNWNTDLVLVLHSWEDLKDDPYIDQIRQLTHTGKVYLSLMNVNWQNMPELLSSADIGLAFYEDLGENFRETGHASNKLVQYLQVGLPVIVSDYPSVMDVITAYQCGEGAGSPRDIEYLARRILDDYERYKENAFRCYESEYDFSKHFSGVTKRIKQIEASS